MIRVFDPARALPRDRWQSQVSVVLPVFNEAAILQQLTAQLVSVLEQNSASFEIVYVNDGSSDGSRELLDELSMQDPRIVVVHLARNFGHQPAVHAGLEHAAGDAVIVMDSDLQDDPQAVPRFLERWEQGFDVVYAERINRKEAWAKRLLFYGFYRVLNAVASIAIPADAGNFGLLDRRVVHAVRQCPERDRYFPGLRSWTGFRQIGIPVERAARHDDRPRVSLRGLFRLAKTAIFSFSAFPLTFFFVIAVLSAVTCAGSISFVVFHKLCTGMAVPGWASVISTASFFGALNALGISILGEYVIRIYDQVRGRPVYLAESVRNYRPAARRSDAGPADWTAGDERAYSAGSVTAAAAEDAAARASIDRVELLLESLHREYQPVRAPAEETTETV